MLGEEKGLVWAIIVLSRGNRSILEPCATFLESARAVPVLDLRYQINQPFFTLHLMSRAFRALWCGGDDSGDDNDNRNP